MKPPTPNRINSIWERFGSADDVDRIFVAELLIHEVEAKVELLVDEPIDELERFVLGAIQFANPPNVQQIDEVLSLGRQIVFRLCESSCLEGLLDRDASEYKITEKGLQTLQTGLKKKTETKCQAFYFLHPILRYLPRHQLPNGALRSLNEQATASNWKFPVSTLDQLISRDSSWKQATSFPQEVQRRLTHEEPNEEPGGKSGEPNSKPLNVSDRAVSVPVIGVVTGGVAETSRISFYSYLDNDSADDSLLTLAEKSTVSAVLDEYLPVPSQEDIEEALRNLFLKNMLESPESSSVSLENGVMQISLRKDSILRWRQFLKSHLRYQVIWPVACGNSWTLFPLVFRGADDAAKHHLRVLELMNELSEKEDRDSLFKSERSLLNWCRLRTDAPMTSLRELADLAFDFGEFEIALSVSEMEDMVDAAV